MVDGAGAGGSPTRSSPTRSSPTNGVGNLNSARSSNGCPDSARTSNGMSNLNSMELARIATDPKKALHGCAYVAYYMVLFFAVWFGAKNFDQDGDGDFDPEDVQIWLAERGWLGEQYKQTAAEKRMAKRRASARRKILAKKEAERQKKAEEAAARGEDISALDRDGDGDVDLDDLIGAEVTGEAQEDKAMEDLMSGRAKPYFILFECGLVLILWAVMATVKYSQDGVNLLETKGGLDSFAEGMTDLRLANGDCEDYRAQVWRWVTYQFTHVGASHVLMNVFLNVMLGIPLEGMHGWWRLAIMFNVGVFGGAMCYMVFDTHTPVVGCSGGCYALIGIHIADILMNWHQKKFRFPTVIMIFTLVAIDVLTYALSTDDGSKSHAAHIGGAIAGLNIGVMVCRNMNVKLYERILAVGLFTWGIVLTIFCLGWMASQEGGPLNFFEAVGGEKGWCWYRQVFSKQLVKNSWVCVRCGTQECIDEWSGFDNILMVKMSVCRQGGWYYDGR